ncbi:MAG: hypothetical protein RL363_920, partial [Bacteroidota bacterium]
MIKKILIVLALVFVVMQFIRPAQNLSANTAKDISTLYPMP